MRAVRNRLFLFGAGWADCDVPSERRVWTMRAAARHLFAQGIKTNPTVLVRVPYQGLPAEGT